MHGLTDMSQLKQVLTNCAVCTMRNLLSAPAYRVLSIYSTCGREMIRNRSSSTLHDSKVRPHRAGPALENEWIFEPMRE